jgi:hypothetical protein
MSQTHGMACDENVERKMALLEGRVAAYSAEMEKPAIIAKKINSFSSRLNAFNSVITEFMQASTALENQ